MADDIGITPGTGANAVTDEITSPYGGGTAHAQGIKILDGTVNGTTVAPVTTRGLNVDTRFLSLPITVTPTVSNGVAYTAKDAVGSNMTFAGAARANGGTGRITKVVITDKGQQMKDLDLVVFNTNPAAATDNAVFAPTDPELASNLAVGTIQIGAGMYADFSTNSLATWTGPALPFACAAGSTSLYGVLVARGTPTYTSTSDLIVTIFVEQD